MRKTVVLFDELQRRRSARAASRLRRIVRGHVIALHRHRGATPRGRGGAYTVR
jgi:hypothetical protein